MIDIDATSRAHLYDLLDQERARATQTERILRERLDALRARAEAAEAALTAIAHGQDAMKRWCIAHGQQRGIAAFNAATLSGHVAWAALATPPPPASREAAVIQAAVEYIQDSFNRAPTSPAVLVALFDAVWALDGAGEPKE